MNELSQSLSSCLFFTIQTIHGVCEHLGKRLYPFFYVFDLLLVGNGLLQETINGR